MDLFTLTVKTIIGEVIAEASLLKFVFRLYQALEQWESAAIDNLLKMTAINVDETSLRVDKKNHWIHVYSAGDITLKFLHPKTRNRSDRGDQCYSALQWNHYS